MFYAVRDLVTRASKAGAEFCLGGGQGRLAAVLRDGGGCLCGISRILQK